METLLIKFNVNKFGEHEGSAIKTIGNKVSLETSVYFISNVSREFNLWTSGKFVEFIVMLQSNPLKILNRLSPADICIDPPLNNKSHLD